MGTADGLAHKSMFPDELALGSYQGDSVPADQISVSDGTRSEIKLEFEDLFERYHSMVFHLTYRVLGDREEALDVSQEVFLTVYRKLPRFRGRLRSRPGSIVSLSTGPRTGAAGGTACGAAARFRWTS